MPPPSGSKTERSKITRRSRWHTERIASIAMGALRPAPWPKGLGSRPGSDVQQDTRVFVTFCLLCEEKRGRMCRGARSVEHVQRELAITFSLRVPLSPICWALAPMFSQSGRWQWPLDCDPVRMLLLLKRAVSLAWPVVQDGPWPEDTSGLECCSLRRVHSWRY
jgi:hypothetical protein